MISYPNEADRARARARGVNPGGYITIHGQLNGMRTAMRTDILWHMTGQKGVWRYRTRQ